MGLSDGGNPLPRYVTLLVILAVVPMLASLAVLTLEQTISVTIIALFITSTFLFWNRRLSFGLIGIFLLLIFGVLDIPSLIEFASLDIIIFLIGMMIIVGYLERSHFFEHLIGRLLAVVGKRTNLLILLLLLSAALSAALIDEVTSILIMTSLVLHISQKYKVNPTPFVLMTIFVTNIGSSATVVGNPVGVMIALKAGLSFGDFLRWATPISIACLFVAIPLIFFLFRRPIRELDKHMHLANEEEENPLTRPKKLLAPSLLFLGTLFGLVLHHPIESALGLEKNTMLIGVALLGAGVAMLFAKDKAMILVERRVDWWTLLFFMFLFASVGSLEYTGVVDRIAEFIINLTGSDLVFTILVIMLFGGIMSAVLDNVLAVAVMIPIIQGLVATGMAGSGALWWTILFTGTLFGNLTFIGSTANIIALGMLQKRKLGGIGFVEWLIPGSVITLATVGVAFLLIYIQLPLMGG